MEKIKNTPFVVFIAGSSVNQAVFNGVPDTYGIMRSIHRSCREKRGGIIFMDGNFDPVEHPSHYTDGKYEVIEFIEGYGLGFHLGNAVKYICRAGKKDPNKEIEDLKKAIWYLTRAIHSPLFCSARAISLNNTMYIIPVRVFCEDKGLSAPLSKAIEYIADARDFETCHMAIRLIEQHIRENIAGIPSQGYPAVNSIKKLILNDLYNDIRIEKREETHE